MMAEAASWLRSAGRTASAALAALAALATLAARHPPSTPRMGAVSQVPPGRTRWPASGSRTCCVRGPTGWTAVWELAGPVRVGEGITGTIRVRATKDIQRHRLLVALGISSTRRSTDYYGQPVRI